MSGVFWTVSRSSMSEMSGFGGPVLSGTVRYCPVLSGAVRCCPVLGIYNTGVYTSTKYNTYRNRSVKPLRLLVRRGGPRRLKLCGTRDSVLLACASPRAASSGARLTGLRRLDKKSRLPSTRSGQTAEDSSELRSRLVPPISGAIDTRVYSNS